MLDSFEPFLLTDVFVKNDVLRYPERMHGTHFSIWQQEPAPKFRN